jgi:hypothetical protein
MGRKCFAHQSRTTRRTFSRDQVSNVNIVAHRLIPRITSGWLLAPSVACHHYYKCCLLQKNKYFVIQKLQAREYYLVKMPSTIVNSIKTCDHQWVQWCDICEASRIQTSERASVLRWTHISHRIKNGLIWSPVLDTLSLRMPAKRITYL